MPSRRLHLVISGRVQGVFFRQSAADEATRLGLLGWVRNLDSGEVEAVAEGPEAALEEFVRWCHRGPTHAKVEAVEVKHHPGEEPLGPFHVERSR